jgi:hypothetical protein
MKKISLPVIIIFILSFGLSCGNGNKNTITQEEYDIYHCRLDKYFTEDLSDRGLILNINTTLPDQPFLDEFVDQSLFSDILGEVLIQKMVEQFLLTNQESCEIENKFGDCMDHMILFSTKDYYSLFGDSLTETLPPPLKSFSRIAFSKNHIYALLYEDIVEHLGLGGEGILLLMKKAEHGESVENDACTEWEIIDEYHL